jgi:GTP-binding protein
MTPFTEAEIEAGRLLFARECDFIIGAAELVQLPDGDRLEICFAGRSNVGKSSLINALTGRKSLARASNTPGRTQQLNYFALEHPDIASLYLVDLPGYGYARAPKKEVERWQGVLNGYLSGRASLRRCFLLIDSRHGVKGVDTEIMDMLDTAAVSYQVVLTKADKVKASELDKVIEGTVETIKKRPAAYPQLIVTSSEKQEGIEDLRAAVARLAFESA